MNDSKDEKDNKTQPKPEPNIAFVGEKGQELPYFNNGMAGRVTLPKAEEQQKPFFHEQAGTIIRLFSDRYKRFKKKGE